MREGEGPVGYLLRTGCHLVGGGADLADGIAKGGSDLLQGGLDFGEFAALFVLQGEGQVSCGDFPELVGNVVDVFDVFPKPYGNLVEIAGKDAKLIL